MEQTAVRLNQTMNLGLDVGVIERRDAPGSWAVEAINSEGDGEIYMAIFSGPGACERAEEYAKFKYDR